MNIQPYSVNNISDNSFRGKKFTPDPDVVARIAGILKLENGDVFCRAQKMSEQQFNLLDSLANKYNERYHSASKKEEPQVLFDIIELLKNQKSIHAQILNNVSVPFENLLNILKTATTKKEVKFVANFERIVFDNQQHDIDFISDIFQSQNRNEYVNNITRYKSYLRLNKENPNAIKELDKMLETNTYKQELYDRKLDIAGLLQEPAIKHIISEKDLDEFYSLEGRNFIANLSTRILEDTKLSEQDKANILHMYKTCNGKNLSIRNYLLDKYKVEISNPNNCRKSLDKLVKIFEKIDNDKDVYKFIDKYLKDISQIDSLSELNKVLEIVPAKKACIFHKNLARIFANTKAGKKRNTALYNELENCMFEPPSSSYIGMRKQDSLNYGITKQESKFQQLYRKLENWFNKLRYSFFKKAEPKIESTEVKEVDTTKAQEIKLKIQKDAMELIRKKLHPNIVAEQENIYVKKASSMRLNMLPEILNSIKETRKAQGKKSKITNRDAIDLYTRINGYNRNIINYMLKKRNLDGSRMFNLQDIMQTLTDANRKVILEKLKRAEVKKLYQDLYQSTVEQYGPLKPNKNRKATL